MVGTGTALNVATVLAGALIGVLLGHRFPPRTREVITDGLGMVTLLVAALSAAAVLERPLSDAVGDSAPVLIILGSVLIGGVVGSLIGIDRRLEALGGLLQRRLTRRGKTAAVLTAEKVTEADLPEPRKTKAKETAAKKTEATVTPTVGGRTPFVEGFVSASLVLSVGPLAVLGALSDGLGHGIDQLTLKSVLDFFTSLAFAASFGWGVAAAGLSVLAFQGTLTAIGFALGGILPEPHVAALTATGGLLLAGVGLRLLDLKKFPSGDLLPALVVAPLLTQLVITFMHG